MLDKQARVDFNNVLTVRFNNPSRKNAWSGEMLREVWKSLDDAKHDAGVKAVVLTDTGDYYCSEVDYEVTRRMILMHTNLALDLHVNSTEFCSSHSYHGRSLFPCNPGTTARSKATECIN